MTILLMLAALSAQTIGEQAVVQVDPAHMLVEGVASDGHTIWVSSVIDRQILACNPRCRPFATLPVNLHPLGLAWDQARRELWIAADCPGIAGVEKCDRGALVGLDRRGRVKSKVAPPAGAFHPGDVSANEGRVTVSDSGSGAVYELVADGKLRALIAPGSGKSAQGSAWDRGRLVVSDYSQGVSVVDAGTGVRTMLPRQDGKPLRGIDGLVRCGDHFIGLYNLTSPGRILSFTVAKGSVEVEELVDGLSVPDGTQVALDGRRLLYVTASGWANIDQGEHHRDTGAQIKSISLPRRCDTPRPTSVSLK